MVKEWERDGLESWTWMPVRIKAAPAVDGESVETRREPRGYRSEAASKEAVHGAVRVLP